MTAAPVTIAEAAAREAMRIADQDPVRALPAAEQAVQIAREERDPAAGAVAERAWGHALVHCGKLDDAISHFRSSAALGRRARSPELVAEARQKLAFAVMQHGHPRAALTEIDAALVDLSGASAGRARAQRAIILHVIGRLDDSLAEYDIALKVLRSAGDQLGVLRMLINRALVHADRHAFPAARRDLAEAERLALLLGRELTVGIIANNLGLVETLYGDVPAALKHLDRAPTGAPHRVTLLAMKGCTTTNVSRAARARRDRRRLPSPRYPAALPTRIGDPSPMSIASTNELVLNLLLTPRFTAPATQIDAIRGCIAVERGPEVLRLESPDVPTVSTVDAIRVDPTSAPRQEGDRTVIIGRTINLNHPSWPDAATPNEAVAAAPEAGTQR